MTARDQALQGREAPSANGGEGGSKKCGRDAVEGGAEAEKERMWMDAVGEGGAGAQELGVRGV